MTMYHILPNRNLSGIPMPSASLTVLVLMALFLVFPNDALSTPTPPLPTGDHYCAPFATSKAFIDGYPACWQTCDATQCVENTEGPAIFSNKGVDTNNTGGIFNSNSDYQCVELAHRYFYFNQKWQIKLPQADAGDFCDQVQVPGSPDADKMVVCRPGTTDPHCANVPMHGDLMIYPRGTGKMSHGHVAVVDGVNPAKKEVDLVEENWVTPQEHPGYRTDSQLVAACWIHAKANTGSCSNGYSGLAAANGAPPPDGKNPVKTATSGCASATCGLEPYALAVYQTGPGVALNVDHGLEVFGRDPNGNLKHAWQNTLGNNAVGWFYLPNLILGTDYPTWLPMGGLLNSDPIVVSRDRLKTTGGPAGDLDVYYIGTDMTICHTYQGNGQGAESLLADLGIGTDQWWSPHYSIIGSGTEPCGSIPADNSLVPAGGQVTPFYDPASKTVQVFYRGKNNSLMTAWQQSYNGKWSAPVAFKWDTVNGATAAPPTATPTTTATPTPTTTMPVTPVNLPPQAVTSNIKVVQNNGQIYLLYRGGDGSLQAIFPYSLHSATAPAPVSMTVPRAVTSNIAAATDPASKGLSILYRGVDYAVWEVPPLAAGGTCLHNAKPIVQTPTGSWCPPTSLGGSVSSDLTTEYLPGGQIRVLYRAMKGSISYVQQNPVIPNVSNAGIEGQWHSWSRHRHLLDSAENTKCVAVPTPTNTPTASSNTSGANLLKHTLFSNIAATVNADGREEVFYYGYNTDKKTQPLNHAWEMTVPTLDNPCSEWSEPASLGADFPECAAYK